MKYVNQMMYQPQIKKLILSIIFFGAYQMSFAQGLSIKEMIDLVQCNISGRDSCFQYKNNLLEKKGFQFSDPYGNNGLFYSGGDGRGVIIYKGYSEIEYSTSFEDEVTLLMKQIEEQKFYSSHTSVPDNTLLNITETDYINPEYSEITILVRKISYPNNDIKYEVLLVKKDI